MSLSLILACLWVVVAAIIAMLPMRRQFAPGLTLLLTAPFLLAYLGYQHNPWLVLAASIAIISMFRRPLFLSVTPPDDPLERTVMTLSLTLAFVWVIVANISAMIPSKDNYWTPRLYINWRRRAAAGLCYL